ncbi:UDP-N-acetylglucosamine diphosphorylase [Flavonifractor sp. An92]|uniref:UDP-N-acetylglucosamine diphosphorylase n=1 Tax=Flavonifractor sp. An92 TaxID=1965666 RepID=UPI000B37B2B3|nr:MULTISPECIES: UDP-N-acetylglucosamine diphosphorylase [unclassified Flavonifractor]OUN02499.1 UDP-N-acetylglucosamine diphosphorylase [Flavonifractor sp. An92]OUQ17569.1 UDP-N-acetylglucosamine diphosphorylase [Flavonifractor sp. An135]
METAGAIVFLPREGNGRSLMLEDLLFEPAALWLAETLRRGGVERFLVVCHQNDLEEAAACFPEGTELITTGTEDANQRLSAFLGGQTGRVVVVTKPVQLMEEDVKNLLSEQPSQSGDDRETGVCRIDAAALAAALESGADFETALRSRADRLGGRSMWLQSVRPLRTGWRERMEAELLARNSGAVRLMEAGVRIMDPNNVYVGPQVTVGAGTVLLPGTILRGKTTIGGACEIGPNSMIRDCVIGDRVTINASQLNESTVEEGTKVGPFAYVRPNCHVGRDVKVGDFVELKNSTIGEGTKISHLTYVGDSDVGSHVNFGCGTVTVNYDGITKYRTTIGDHAFIGCNTNLVAPVKIGDGAYTAAGSTITDEVPADSLAIARSQQVVKKQWAAKRRSRRK